VGEDAGGALWIGTDAGLNRLQDGRMTALTARDGRPGARARRAGGPARRALGRHLRGLVRMDGGRVTAVYRTADGLVNDLVWTLLEDRSGTLWIGTSDGVSRFADGSFESLTPRDGVPNGHVRALGEDREGSVWIGTNGGGLLRLRDGRFTRITERDGLPDAIIRTILQDHAGAIWIGTNRGLARVQKGRVSVLGPAQDSRRARVLAARGPGGRALDRDLRRRPVALAGRPLPLWRAQDGSCPRRRHRRPAVQRRRARHPPGPRGRPLGGTEAGLNDWAPMAVSRSRRAGRLPATRCSRSWRTAAACCGSGPAAASCAGATPLHRAGSPLTGYGARSCSRCTRTRTARSGSAPTAAASHRLRDGRITAVGMKEACSTTWWCASSTTGTARCG
jgi:hypothetical protein